MYITKESYATDLHIEYYECNYHYYYVLVKKVLTVHLGKKLIRENDSYNKIKSKTKVFRAKLYI